MFTGIIEEIGVVRQAGTRLTVSCSRVLSDATEGSSISVNGVCLTALDIQPGSFSADLAPETLNRSNLGALIMGSRVNLERPLLPSSRLSGHFVQGHVDGKAEILGLELLGGENWWLRIRLPENLVRYFVEKGSISVDGISLTIAAISGRDVSIAIIPHTYQNTALQFHKPGDLVNIEVDVIAKHVEKLLSARAQEL